MFDYLADHPEEGALFAGSMSDATGMVIDDVASAVDLGGVSRWRSMSAAPTARWCGP